MKRFYLFAVMMCSLLIACTMEKEPSTLKQQRIFESETRFPIGSYENLYDTIKIRVIPNIMELYDVQELFDDIIIGYLDEDDIDTLFIRQMGEHNQESILQMLEDALEDNDIPLDLEDNNLAWHDYYMAPILSEMRDSVYITSNFRYEKIYTNFYLTEYEKFSLCLLAAINNTIFEELYNNTVVIRDDIHEFYYSTQFHPTTNLPVQWTNPWDIYEIHVEDISLFDPIDIGGYIAHEYGNYIPFHTYEECVSYLETLEHGYDMYYVTSEECEVEREEAEDRLLTDVAFGIVLSAATAPEALMVASFVCLVYYEAQHLKIEQQYRDCLASAEDEE